MAAEIERKWVAERTPPPERLGTGTPLRQGYLAIDGDVAVRVRIAPDEAWVTIKAGDDGLRRTEVELPVDAAEAEELWVHTAGRIEKVRHDVAVDDAAAVVDVFGGDARWALHRRGRVPDRIRQPRPSSPLTGSGRRSPVARSGATHRSPASADPIRRRRAIARVAAPT